ncbi:hypothetical protein ABV409_02860 [Flagellimonas sp. DF-77]|uniref:hypothetical protein n=1 Tax=Flagellimonas algarum TaxID=3230298 RepID=UPI0033991D85
MKRIIKNILGVASLASLLIFTACEDGDTVFDTIIDAEQRGAILRTVNLVSNELPIGDASGNFTVELEVQDQANGNNVSSVEVYVGFRDNTENVGPGTDVAEALFETVDSSTFAVGEFGLPRFTYSVTLPAMLSFVGRNDADITGGDQFTVRFELVLTDGRRFSFADNSGTLTGSFFSSPFLYTPLVICPVPEAYFTGQYAMTQTSGSAPFGIADGFTQPMVEVTANGTNRSIAFIYDPDGFDINYTFSLDLVCDEIQGLTGSINSGSLGCGNGSIGQTGVGVFPYDLDDDSSFTLVFEDFNPDGGCTGNTYEATIVLTKL